jgi:cysteine sulfinate desulfinase/cysteine desulfurase-like protein
LANASIRLGLGRFTTAAEVDFAADALADAAARLRDTHKMAEAAGVPT